MCSVNLEKVYLTLIGKDSTNFYALSSGDKITLAEVAVSVFLDLPVSYSALI